MGGETPPNDFEVMVTGRTIQAYGGAGLIQTIRIFADPFKLKNLHAAEISVTGGRGCPARQIVLLSTLFHKFDNVFKGSGKEL